MIITARLNHAKQLCKKPEFQQYLCGKELNPEDCFKKLKYAVGAASDEQFDSVPVVTTEFIALLREYERAIRT